MDDVTKKDGYQPTSFACLPVPLPFIRLTGQKVEIEILFVPIFFCSLLVLPFCYSIFMAWPGCTVHTAKHTLQIFDFDVLFHSSIDLLLKLIKMYEMLLNVCHRFDSNCAHKICRIWRNQCFISRKTIRFYNINFPGSTFFFFLLLTLDHSKRTI